MANTATTIYDPTAQSYRVDINGKSGVYMDTQTNANTLRDRLNALFSDSNRDLDFITPSHDGSRYIISCPLVRKNIGEKTYFYDTSSNPSSNYYGEKLYEPTNNTDPRTSAQTLLYQVGTSNTMPWYDALYIANLIRSCVNLNFADAKGSSTCTSLVMPTNKKGTVASTISSSATCDYYGLPCQGTQAGTTSTCPEIGYPAQNILNATTGNGEVLHPQGLTAAMTSTNSWNSTYKNKFVKVTNLSDTSKSIVVKITDTAPANRGIELSYRAWVSIGKPSGTNSVKIELMST